MKIAFTKMSGAGNDFVFLGPEYGALRPLLPSLAKILCARKASVGADGLVLAERTGDQIGGEIRMHYLNSDGSRASFCGNAARCLVRYCIEKGLAAGPVRFRSDLGSHLGEIAGERVRIEMDAPVLLGQIDLDIDAQTFRAYLIDAGVPHAVIPIQRVSSIDVETIGRRIRHLPAFQPEGTNVDFLSTEGPPFRLRTYERGVESETLACGSGCMAAALALNLVGLAGGSVSLEVASGDVLTVELAGSPDGVQHSGMRPRAHLTGPAVITFEGQVEIKETANV